MAATESTMGYSAPAWKCKEIIVTKKIVLRWKIKTEKFLHCKQCRVVLSVGCVAVKTTTTSKAILSETAKRSLNIIREEIFCSDRCGRLYLLEHIDSSVPNPLRLLPVLDDRDDYGEESIMETHQEMHR